MPLQQRILQKQKNVAGSVKKKKKTINSMFFSLAFTKYTSHSHFKDCGKSFESMLLPSMLLSSFVSLKHNLNEPK